MTARAVTTPLSTPDQTDTVSGVSERTVTAMVEITIDDVLEKVRDIYESAKHDRTIRKPISYALYKVWFMCNSAERNRRIRKDGGGDE